MKTSKQWWEEIKADNTKLENWLQRQWRGEVTAAYRILRLASYVDQNSREYKILDKIADQERQHARWIEEILESRGIEVLVDDIKNAEQRYWAQTLPSIKDFVTGTAVAAHAEKMRLERITEIANDETAPEDIRSVFKKILVDEVWHESAFRNLSTPEAMAAMSGSHELGKQSLGLEA